jgi:hypothetical protein
MPVGLGAEYRQLFEAGARGKALLRPIYFRALGRNLTMFLRR